MLELQQSASMSNYEANSNLEAVSNQSTEYCKMLQRHIRLKHKGTMLLMHMRHTRSS